MINNLEMDWIKLYKYKNEFMKELGFSTVSPYEFYRDLFPIGSLQKKDESFNNNNKGNIVGISIDLEIYFIKLKTKLRPPPQPKSNIV